MSMTPENNSQQGAKYTLDTCHGDAIVLCDGIFFAEAQDITCAQQIIDALNEREALKEKVERYERALKQFRDCELTEANCLSFEVANSRIRSIARAALLTRQPK